MPARSVTTYYLQMRDPRDLRPKHCDRADLEVKQAQVPLPELNRFLYTAVGGDWYWIDRLGWNYRRWLEWVDRSELQTWIAHVAGTPAGYFELEAQAGGDVELAYFGLIPRFVGMGLGGHLLSTAIEQAWRMDAKRVWVHTCTLDHPAALANYRARGFTLYREETTLKVLPEQPTGPWPGSGTV